MPDGFWTPLGETRLKSRKIVVAWALEADLEPAALVPGHFMMGDRSYPEIDRVEWFDANRARTKLNLAQAIFVERLEHHLQDLIEMRKDRT